MTEAQIKMLASYLGGGSQTFYSIGLQMGAPMPKYAGEFFKLRDAFGVKSYASVEEAEQQIRSAIAPVKA